MGRRTPSRQQAEEILRGDLRGDSLDLLRRLPADVDARLAADVVISLLGSAHSKGCWLLGRNCQRMPAPVVRKVLEHLVECATTVDHDYRDVAIFVTTLVSSELPDDKLASTWETALLALLDLNTTYGWGSKQRRAKIRGVAGDANMVAAIQAVAVGCEKTPMDMLAVLCADGSDASFDALMPHFDRAEKSGERLEWLGRLRKHANPESRGVQSLLDTAAARLAVLSGESPAVALAAQIGFGQLKVFWFDAYLGSTESNENNVAAYQGSIRVDSRSPDWFSVYLTHVTSTLDWVNTRFNHEAAGRDDLDLGSCAAEDLPAWLGRAAKQLGVTWSVHLRTSLRGKKRQALEAWLLRR